MAKSQVATGGAKRTAPPRESARSERARTNRLEAGARVEKKRGAKGETQLTEDYFSRRSQAEHSENPDRPADSTVRHALPQTGADTSGQKGFPQGEYDVVEPTKAAAGSKKSTHDMLIDQHLGLQDPDELIERADKRARLSPKERILLLEAAPAGFVIEKEGDNRWRAGFGNRYGHGTTASEAIESYVLGQTGPQTALEDFKAYPASVQKEIVERDKAVAKRSGIPYESTPEAIAREEGVPIEEARGLAASGETSRKSAARKTSARKGAAKKGSAKKAGKRK